MMAALIFNRGLRGAGALLYAMRYRHAGAVATTAMCRESNHAQLRLIAGSPAAAVMRWRIVGARPPSPAMEY